MKIKDIFLIPAKAAYGEALRKLLSEYNASYEFVFLPQGLGDILFYCMYANEYRRKNPSKHLAIITTKPHIFSLTSLFDSCFDLILQIDMKLFYTSSTNRFTYMYPKIYNDCMPQKNLLDAMRNAMGLDPSAERWLPDISISTKIRQQVREMRKPNYRKVVLISPDANSCNKIISDSEWIALAEYFSHLGYKVVFNSDSDKYNGYKCIFLNIRESIEFCNCIDLFIGYRSGLCDVVAAFCECKQIIVYPNDRKPGEFQCVQGYDDDPNKKYLEFCSLKDMFPKADVHEIIYQNLLNQIGEIING